MGLTATGDAERLSRLAVPLLPEPQQLAEALARLPKKGFPLNVARRLQAAGGPQMPPPAQLLADDPESQQRAENAKDEALAYIRGKLGVLR